MSISVKENIAEQYSYKGDPISARSLESTISSERERQNVAVEKLKVLREANDSLNINLAEEARRLRKISDFFSKGSIKGFLWMRLKEILSRIPGLKNSFLTHRSIEDLLKQQYEISAKRVKEAAGNADRLKTAQQDIFKEIERLNRKIIESAKNEAVAADAVLELRDLLAAKKQGLAAAAGSRDAAYRKLQAEADEVKQILSEHATLFDLYSSAEDRLARLKENTGRLQETMTDLFTDIRKYVPIAFEKLDDAFGQIQAIGAAADATAVLLRLKQSLDVMTASMNQTTEFVSETQILLRGNLDNLISDLEVYDEETRKIIQANLEKSQVIEQIHIDRAIEKAIAFKEKQAASVDA